MEARLRTSGTGFIRRAAYLGVLLAALTVTGCGGGSGVIPLEEVAAPTVIAFSDVYVRTPVARPAPPEYQPLPAEEVEVPAPAPVPPVVAASAASQVEPAPARPAPAPPRQAPAVAPPQPPPPVAANLAPAPASPWRATASASAASIAAGSTQTFTVFVENSKSANAVVDVEIFDAAGKRVHQSAMPNVFLAAGRHRFNASWAIPRGTPPGTYTVSVGIFEPGWAKLIAWQDAVAKFNVTAR